MRKWILLLFLFVGIAAFVTRPDYLHTESNPYHSSAFVSSYGGLPDTLNSLFTGSGKCAGCHSSDPNSYASIPGQVFPAVPMPGSWDVNPTDMWRSSLMANSAKDPFWRAKVAHEVAVNPGHQVEIEDKCTSCHAPLGHFAAKHDGIAHYSMEMLLSDSLALDGVSCVACHQLSRDSSGFSFSGQLYFDSAVIYGPYGSGKDEPLLYTLPMETYTGYVPMYGQHIEESAVCADCHTLVTQIVDLEGNYTGDVYVEQATYHEWVNSVFSGEGVDLPLGSEGSEATCQSCHMPRLEDPVIISSGYAFLEPRSPFGLHTLVGANTAMLEIMRDNVEGLGLTATAAQFDSTLSRTLDMLLGKSISLDIIESGFSNELEKHRVKVELINLAGHKFPSGFPARRVFVELIVDFEGDTLFHSGKLDQSGAYILGADELGLTDYERHHDVISNESQVQIYELVSANVLSMPTNVLEQAAVTLKDNRLVPYGFSMNHPAYDTTRVEGEVLFDPNFNYSEGEYGSGSDVVSYELPLDVTAGIPYLSSAVVTVNVYYQSMPPRWVESMFDYNYLQPVADFQVLFEEHGSAAVLVASATDYLAGNTSVSDVSFEDVSVSIGPNPSSDGVTILSWSGMPDAKAGYEVFDARGNLVKLGSLEGVSGKKTLQLPMAKGTYIIHVNYNGGTKSLRAVRL